MDSFDQEVANMFYSVQQITKKKSGTEHVHSQQKQMMYGSASQQPQPQVATDHGGPDERLQLAHLQAQDPAQYLHAMNPTLDKYPRHKPTGGIGAPGRGSNGHQYNTRNVAAVQGGSQQQPAGVSTTATSEQQLMLQGGKNAVPPAPLGSRSYAQAYRNQVQNHLAAELPKPQNQVRRYYEQVQQILIDTTDTNSQQQLTPGTSGDSKSYGVKVSDRYAGYNDMQQRSSPTTTTENNTNATSLVADDNTSTVTPQDFSQTYHQNQQSRRFAQNGTAQQKLPLTSQQSSASRKQPLHQVQPAANGVSSAGTTPYADGHVQQKLANNLGRQSSQTQRAGAPAADTHQQQSLKKLKAPPLQLHHQQQPSADGGHHSPAMQQPYHRARSSCSMGQRADGTTNAPSSSGQQFKRKIGGASASQTNLHEQDDKDDRSPTVKMHQFQDNGNHQALTRARSAGKPFGLPSSQHRTQPQTMQATAILTAEIVTPHQQQPQQQPKGLMQTQVPGGISAAGGRIATTKKMASKSGQSSQQRSLTHRAKSSNASNQATGAGGKKQGEMLLKTDLTGQGLGHVPLQLAPNLSWLVLDDNQISQIGSRSLPPKIMHLSLERNQLVSIYTTELEEVRNTLKTINVRANHLQSIQALSICTLLKDLNLAQNQIGDAMLASTLPGLKKLRRLDISGNQLQNGFKVMDAIHGLKGLKILKMSENSMVSQLRFDVSRHFRMRELSADQNKFQSLIIERSALPTQKQSDSQLRTLNLSCNHLGKYEGKVQGLSLLGSSLLDLNLSQNFLDHVSFCESERNSLFGLNQLRSLNLSNNQIRSVKWSATPNGALKTLDLSYNKIGDISGVKMFEALVMLKVQANPFEQISLQSLRHLKDLSIDQSKLTSQALQMQQLGPRLKRINSISIQVIYKDLMRQEATQQEHKGDGGAATCQAVVGGGAGSGLGPGHMATTLTSFNVSAIALNHPLSLESPGHEPNLAYENNGGINAQEKQEIYQQVIQLEHSTVSGGGNPHDEIEEGVETVAPDEPHHHQVDLNAVVNAYGGFDGQPPQPCFGGGGGGGPNQQRLLTEHLVQHTTQASASSERNRQIVIGHEEEFFTLQGKQHSEGAQPTTAPAAAHHLVDINALQFKLKTLENDFRRAHVLQESKQQVFDNIVNLFQQTLDNMREATSGSNDHHQHRALQSSQKITAYSNNDYSTVGQIEPAIISKTGSSSGQKSPYADTHGRLTGGAAAAIGGSSSASSHHKQQHRQQQHLHQNSPLVGTSAPFSNEAMAAEPAHLALPILATQCSMEPASSSAAQRISNLSASKTSTHSQQQLPHLYLPVKHESNDDGLTVVSKKQPVNADMLIHSFRPFLAELLNIISYTQLRMAEIDSKLSNHDILCNVLKQVAESLQLMIEPGRLTQLIEQNQNQGMFYAVRSKPESLLYYPVFKLILQEGWTGMPTEVFKELIQSQIQTIQAKIAEQQGLTRDRCQIASAGERPSQTTTLAAAATNQGDLVSARAPQDNSKQTMLARHIDNINDLPLASKETMTLDSHRPLSYETQTMLRLTDYNIKTPNMEDFMTRDSNNGGAGGLILLNAEEEREDRIRTIQATSDDEATTNEQNTAAAFTKKSSAIRTGKASQPRQQSNQQQNSNNSHVKEAQLKALYAELVVGAVKPIPQDLLTESQHSQSATSENRLIFERILSQHQDYKVLKQIFRMASHSKMLSVYKRHDPQTQLLRSSIDNLTIGWIGCVTEMQKIADAFEELRTEGLKVTKTINEVVNWVIADKQANQQQKTTAEETGEDLTMENTTEGGKKGTVKAQWRVVACLISDRFEAGSSTKQRLVHPCYIIDFQFKMPSGSAGAQQNTYNSAVSNSAINY